MATDNDPVVYVHLHAVGLADGITEVLQDFDIGADDEHLLVVLHSGWEASIPQPRWDIEYTTDDTHLVLVLVSEFEDNSLAFTKLTVALLTNSTRIRLRTSDSRLRRASSKFFCFSTSSSIAI